MSESGDSSAASTITSLECSPSSSTPSSPVSSLQSSPPTSPPSSPTVVLPKSPIKKDSTVKRPTRPTLAHPSTSVMVTTAIKSLKDKKGSTLPMIKKYLAINYQVDSAKYAPYIRKYLKSAVAKGQLIQTNGTGANGHFKLPAEKKPVGQKKADVPAAGKKKLEAKKPVAKKKVPTLTSGKRRSIEEATMTTTTVSKAKKPKKVVKAVVKPKTKKTVEVAAKAAPAKTKDSKLVTKKAPTKKSAPKKK